MLKSFFYPPRKALNVSEVCVGTLQVTEFSKFLFFPPTMGGYVFT